jgi:AcrR family transcriptional regulator
MTRKKPPQLMRKTPTQARARATVDAILEATARILSKDGYDALTTNRVAEAAGVSVGSLYQYFPEKVSLIAALSKRHLDDLERTLDDASAHIGGLPFAAIVQRLIAANVAAHLIDPDLHRALSDALPPQGKEDWRIAFAERAKARVRALLKAHADDLAVKDLDLATYIVMRSVEACVHDGYAHRRADMISGRIAEEVSALVLCYLTGVSMRNRRGRRRPAAA